MAPTSKSSNKSSSAAVEPSIVEKLNLLRSFVGNNNVSETDLSTCLRQSSYNIEMAAERFLTGQYQPPPPSKRRKPSAEVATPTTAKQPAPRRHAATTIMAPVVTPKTPKNHNTQPTTTITTTTGWWLLCQRWISDGICTQRNGCLDYRERLTVEHAGMSGMLRFRGAKMQGQFPKALGSFGVLASKNLIQFEAQALMEERYLPIGAHVAFSLR